jgi:hypothetical protein
MKTSAIASLLAVAATGALAQAPDNQTAPFALRLQSGNTTLDGAYLYACHAGAAIEGLCAGGKEGSITISSTFYLNTTITQLNGWDVGSLVWNLPITNGDGTSRNVSSPAQFSFPINSNVAVPLFQPSYGNYQFGFDVDEKLFVYTVWDDSKTVYGQWLQAEPTAVYHWVVCFQLTGGYWYTSLGWVTAGEPHNPTCEAVNVVRHFI